MAGFGTFQSARRAPAQVGELIVDPAGWEPQDIVAADDWIYTLDDTDIGEIAAAADAAV